MSNTPKTATRTTGRKVSPTAAKTAAASRPRRTTGGEHSADLSSISTTLTEIKEQGRKLTALIDSLVARFG